MSRIAETPETIRQKIGQFLEGEVFLDREDRHLGPADPLFNGPLDSPGTLRPVVSREETFGPQVADGELVPENVEAIQRLASYVRRKTGASGQARSQYRSRPAT